MTKKIPWITTKKKTTPKKVAGISLNRSNRPRRAKRLFK